MNPTIIQNAAFSYNMLIPDITLAYFRKKQGKSLNSLPETDD